MSKHNYYFTGNTIHDRHVISSAHVKQIERTPRHRFKWNESASSSDESDSDEESCRELASVVVDATTATPPSPPPPSNVWVSHVTSIGGKRRKERRQRWNQTGSSCNNSSIGFISSFDDYTSLKQHPEVNKMISSYWEKLCLRAFCVVHDDAKIKVRQWIIFFKRVGDCLDWDSELCAPVQEFFSGKHNKHSFTKEEFSDFLFHELLAPRVKFCADPMKYVRLGNKLFADVFQEETRWGSQSQPRVLNIRKRPRTSSLSTPRTMSRGGRYLKTKKATDDLDKHAFLNRTDSDQQLEKENKEKRHRLEKNRLDADAAIKRRNTLIHKYTLLCPFDDLLELQTTTRCLKNVKKTILLYATLPSFSKRHRLSWECLQTESKTLRIECIAWSKTSNISKMWVAASAPIVADQNIECVHTSAIPAASGNMNPVDPNDEVAVQFSVDCAKMFQLHLKIYRHTKLNRILAILPLLQRLLSGKYTFHQHQNIIDYHGGASSSNGSNGSNNNCPGWGHTQLMFAMNNNGECKLKGTIKGFGIALGEQKRTQYTIEGQFNWTRGNVSFVKRNGTETAQFGQSGQSGHPRRKKKENVEKYVGQLVVLPKCLVIKCKRTRVTTKGDNFINKNTNNGFMGGSNNKSSRTFLLMTNYDQDTISLKSLRMSMERQDTIAKLSTTLINRQRKPKDCDRGTEVPPLIFSSTTTHQSTTVNNRKSGKYAAFHHTFDTSGYCSQQKTSPVAGSVDANLKAFAAAKNRAKRDLLRAKHQKANKAMKKNPPKIQTIHWKPRLTQQLQVNSANNSIPITRPHCIPKIPDGSRSLSGPSSPRSLLSFKKHRPLSSSRHGGEMQGDEGGDGGDDEETLVEHFDIR